MPDPLPESMQRWTAKWRAALMLSILKDEQIRRQKKKVDVLVLDVDILKEATNGRPFAPRTSDE